MALIVKDRVRETTNTTGTGTLTLIAPVTGFQSFSVIGDGNQTYYSIVDVATGAFEVGIGTYTASGTTLSRQTVLESSNANALVNFGSGTKDVFVTYPSDRSVSQADIGTAPNEVPLNQYLGNLAYQDAGSIAGNVGVGGLVTATSGVINANTSDTAFRITQTGSGNALVVEDSTSPDSTPVVIDAAGRVIVGGTTSGANAGLVQTQGSGANQFSAYMYPGATTGAARLNFNKSRATEVGSYVSVNNNDNLGEVRFFGDDGASFIQSAQIRADVDGTPGTDDMPGRLVFSTTADGASAPTERMRIDNAGNTIQQVNTTAPTLTTNQTLNFSLLSNSMLRISVRGSDGVTRTATVALV